MFKIGVESVVQAHNDLAKKGETLREILASDGIHLPISFVYRNGKVFGGECTVDDHTYIIIPEDDRSKLPTTKVNSERKLIMVNTDDPNGAYYLAFEHIMWYGRPQGVANLVWGQILEAYKKSQEEVRLAA